jgi:hypothetical protein
MSTDLAAVPEPAQRDWRFDDRGGNIMDMNPRAARFLARILTETADIIDRI